MQRLRLLSLALLAILAVAAIASASAFALENPEILPNPTEAKPLNFTSKSGAGTLITIGGNAITCADDTNEGKFTSARLGPVTVTFLTCTSTGGVKCKTAGAEAGKIVLEAGIHLVDFKKGTTLTLGAVITLSKNIVITCGVLKDEVKGSVMGEVSGVTSGVETSTGTLTFTAKEKGVQLLSKCELDKTFCEGKTFKLEASFNGSTFESASEETTDEMKFAEKIRIDF